VEIFISLSSLLENMKRGIVFLLMLIILISISSFDESQLGEPSYSINLQYAPSDYIRGWINISLINEPVNSLFETNFEDSIRLIDLLKLNNAEEDICIPRDCFSDYSASNASEMKTFNLISKTSKIIGLRLDGNIETINSADFVLESDAVSSCLNQIKIDFLNDGIVDFSNNKVINSLCFSENYGCFDDSQESDEGVIGSSPYCQRIKLYEFPGFRLGAWVKEEVSGNKDLTIAIYNVNGEEVTNCELPASSTEGGEIYCDVDHVINEPEDYYVCIYTDEGTGTYKAKGYYDIENGCGFYGWPTKTETSAYHIFAQGKRFNSVGTLNITNSLQSGETLAGLIQGYILDKYGNMNCVDGCVIPIKFISGEDQEIIIQNLSIKFDIVGLAGKEEKDFYELNETSAIVNADFLILNLDNANFSVPSNYGNITFKLMLDGVEIFSKKISIEKVPIIKRIEPTKTASAFPTEFKVVVGASETIIKYQWDFGDGKTKTTTTNKVTHTYNSTGTYKMEIVVTDANQRSSNRIFDMVVESPKELINSMLTKKQQDLTNIKIQLNELNSFSKESLNEILDIESLNEQLKEIQTANASASSEQNYNDIMATLLYLKIPESISLSKEADSISFYPDKSVINLEILEVIGGGKYNSNNEDNYRDSILSWNQQNMETKITLKEFSAIYEEFEESLLKVFELKITKKTSLDYNPYLILLKLDDIKFKENYPTTEESGYFYMDLENSEERIIFSTTEEINFVDLSAFISPEISKLPVISTSIFDKEEKGWKWALFILIVFLLVLIGTVVYIVLQIWYKKKYETYLFKNRNKLYNLITYIQNAKRGGLKNKEISTKLKKAGWGSEKVRYVMRKYAGQRTGMFEIPVKNFFDKFKKSAGNSNHRFRHMPVRRNFNLKKTRRFEQGNVKRRFFKNNSKSKRNLRQK